MFEIIGIVVTAMAGLILLAMIRLKWIEKHDNTVR